jgi:hypothetical protein
MHDGVADLDRSDVYERETFLLRVANSAQIENQRRRQGRMKLSDLAQFLGLTVILTIGLAGVITVAHRVNISENWEEKRCDPYIIPIASFFKPSNDERTPSQFAADNFDFCQKVYIQNTIRVAASVPQRLADIGAANVGVMQDIAGTVSDVFVHLWRAVYDIYAGFMEQMKVAAKLFQNFFINMYSIIERIQASLISLVFGLIALIVTTINSIQLALIVAIIVIGIIIALQILLFFVLIPIFGMIATATIAVSVSVVAVATAIAAVTIRDMFSSGACFVEGTHVRMMDGTRPIEAVVVGDRLSDGGFVTATHRFRASETVWRLGEVGVTGDHVVYHEGRRIFVRDHPEAVLHYSGPTDLYCLTTTSRTIPCGDFVFADWEEISDEEQGAWHAAVWRTLNPGPPAPAADADAGLAPDCGVTCLWMGQRVTRPITEIRIGDIVCDGPDSTTRVVGTVTLAGDLTTDAIAIGAATVTAGTWIWAAPTATWVQATGPVVAIHPIRWFHLYTESGVFLVGDLLVRDASEVGLANLGRLVESVVIKESEYHK